MWRRLHAASAVRNGDWLRRPDIGLGQRHVGPTGLDIGRRRTGVSEARSDQCVRRCRPIGIDIGDNREREENRLNHSTWFFCGKMPFPWEVPSRRLGGVLENVEYPVTTEHNTARRHRLFAHIRKQFKRGAIAPSVVRVFTTRHDDLNPTRREQNECS